LYYVAFFVNAIIKKIADRGVKKILRVLVMLQLVFYPVMFTETMLIGAGQMYFACFALRTFRLAIRTLSCLLEIHKPATLFTSMILLLGLITVRTLKRDQFPIFPQCIIFTQKTVKNPLAYHLSCGKNN